MSMQRAAILVVLASILVISFFALKLKKALIIFVLLPISTQIVFNGMQGEFSRILNIDNLNHTNLYYSTEGKDSNYRGGKVLFDLSAIHSRLSIVNSWRKAFNDYKAVNTTKTPNTYELHRIVLKEVKLEPSIGSMKALQVPDTPHSYLLNLELNYGRIAFFSVILSYFSIVIPIARIVILNNKKRFISIAYIMAIVNYFLVSLVHNNGHFLLDSVGWIGIGLLLVYIHYSIGKLNEPT
jgi:hypothetical protein